MEFIKKTAHEISPETVILLEYPVHPKPRWTKHSPHKELYEIINRNRIRYKTLVNDFLEFNEFFSKIAERQSPDNFYEPSWINGWLPGLDGIALYSFIVFYKPAIYLEIGSGNSTKFARRAIRDHKLSTKIISIDPRPRSDIDLICDEIIRIPVEDLKQDIFDQLGHNDILFIDNSHTALMNSDSTVLLLEIIPRLKPGVLIEIHDITLPYDYPEEYRDRYYSEQYLLAAYLIGNCNLFDIILPNMFISQDPELKNILNPLWEYQNLRNAEKHGCSFWIIKK